MCKLSARSWAAVRVTEKLRFCARGVVLSFDIGRVLNSAKNESSHASGAADTEENEPR